MATTQKELKAYLYDEAVQTLTDRLLPAGQFRIYTQLAHVAKSGMTRSIKLYVVPEAGTIVNITRYVANLLDKNLDRYDGITVRGCGFDAGFDLVCRVSLKLYQDGYKLKREWL